MELTTTEEVAGALEAAFAAGPDESQALLLSLFADEVDLHHVPALASDGPVAGSRLREVTGQEAAAIKGLLPDQSFEEVQVVVDGDRVRVTAGIRGTMATGEPVRLKSDMHLTVDEGRIVGLEHHMDEETMAGWMAVAAAAGLSGE